MSEKQTLGPIQRKWIEALRSGKYKQGRALLCGAEGYCCLGIACEVLESPRTVVGRVTSFRGHDAFPHRTDAERLKLRSTSGLIVGGPMLRGKDWLAGANDEGATFSEIADFIEANPAAVFTEPA